MSDFEIWKDIVGWEGKYQISNWGRVKSVSRKVCNAILCRTQPEQIMVLSKNNNGYMYILLRNKQIRKKYYIHRLVAEAFFVKKNPESDQVNHKNKNRTDNHYSNLEWCTQTENCAHRDNNEPF
jgi:hypothetical protein